MQKLLREIRGFFLSPKTTISLLSMIALVSIIGTLIPQQKEVGEYIEHYGQSFYRMLDFFGFFNLFGSWWFRLLLVLLMINLVVCSLKRLPRTLTMRGATRKEWIGRLGPHLTHLSIIVILVGSLIGSIWGFKGYVTIPQGESIDAVALNGATQEVNLDFAIRCDKFSMSHYPGSQIAKDYLSDLTVLEGGREVRKKTIRVNDPLRYKGISFYQSSYGVMPPRPGHREVELEIIPKGDNVEAYQLRITEGESKQIPGTGETIQFAGFIPDFGLGTENRPFSRSEELNNPAIQVNIYRKDKLLFTEWSFLNYPDFHGSKNDLYKVKFLGFSGERPYTGLMVVKDPGVPVVWTGFGMLVLGLCASFFFHPRPSPKKN